MEDIVAGDDGVIVKRCKNMRANQTTLGDPWTGDPWSVHGTRTHAPVYTEHLQDPLLPQ